MAPEQLKAGRSLIRRPRAALCSGSISDSTVQKVVRMYRFCIVCVCLSVRVTKTDNFIIHYITFFIHLWGWIHSSMSVCTSVCLSARAQKVHLKGSKLLKLTWNLSWLCWAWDPAMLVTTPWSLSVWWAGQTLFGTGSGVCPGLFAHLTDFVQLLITFKHCLGHADKKSIHINPPAAGYAIQPWVDSSVRCRSFDSRHWKS